MKEWSLPCCILAVVLVVSLASIVRSGFDKSIQLTRTSRLIRIIGGGLWLTMALTGIAFKIWQSLFNR